MRRNLLSGSAVFLSILSIVACTSYKSREVPFRAPSSFANVRVIADAQVAAQAYADKKVAREAFGFDIRSAGLLPVQVVIDNTGTKRLSVVPEQTFLVDAEGNMWNLLDRRTAYQRLEGSSEYSRIAKGAGRGSLLGGAGGAVIGAAIGILTGENVGTAATKGAAIGAAGGAVVGGAQSGTASDPGREITRDLANKELENKAIPPGSLGRGFLFFPGEATSATSLRLQLKEEAGNVHTVTFPLQ